MGIIRIGLRSIHYTFYRPDDVDGIVYVMGWVGPHSGAPLYMAEVIFSLAGCGSMSVRQTVT